MNATNAVAACAQVALLVAACAGLPRLLGLRSPSIHYLFWRVLLAACLVLPLLAPRVPHEMVFVPAPAGAALPMPGTDASPASSALPAPAAIDWWRAGALVIVAGAAARLAWIGLGILRLGRMRRRAREEAAGFADLKQAIGVAAPILWSVDVTHPVTFGARRPVVLLPNALKSVDAAAQRAVVAHELHHVKRRDWLCVVAEEVVRSLLWFHPAVWWLISRVQLARETVVDELSILTTNARRAYLDTLLAFADDTGLQSTPAFSARRHLFHRVMLLSKEEGMSSVRIAVASCVLVAALGAGAWGAAHAFPLYQPEQPPPPPPSAPRRAADQRPPRDAQTPAAYQRLAQEQWEKAYGDLSLTPEMRLDLVLKAIANTDRALAIDPDYLPSLNQKYILLRMQANLTADAGEKERLVAQADEVRAKAHTVRPVFPPPPPPPPPGVAGGVPGGVAGGVPGGVAGEQMLFMPESFERQMKELNPVRIGGGVKAPAKIRDVKPVYPPIAQQAHVQGVVIIEAIIDGDGTVADARILRSIPLLDQAALEAVQQWKFAPVQLNGAPTAVLMTVTVNFRIQQ